jgi:hypothetical protein
MSISILSRLLLPERYRQRAAPGVGFSPPIMSETLCKDPIDPYLVSNTKGSFVLSRRGPEGTVRYGYFECPVDEEPSVVSKIYDTMWNITQEKVWGNCCSRVSDAIVQLRMAGLQPRSLVISLPLALRFCEADGAAVAESLTRDGYATTLVCPSLPEGLRVLVAPLPESCAILCVNPKLSGVYCRIGDYLGLQLYNVPKNFVILRGVM